MYKVKVLTWIMSAALVVGLASCTNSGNTPSGDGVNSNGTNNTGINSTGGSRSNGQVVNAPAAGASPSALQSGGTAGDMGSSNTLSATPTASPSAR